MARHVLAPAVGLACFARPDARGDAPEQVPRQGPQGMELRPARIPLSIAAGRELVERGPRPE
eukprot:6396180-Lingulodinium_polyedra.AAC.1